jgi:hypothetical protein
MKKIELKTVEKQLFLDHTVVEAAVRRNAGGSLGHSGSAVTTPDVINASTTHGYRLSSCLTENTPSARDVVHSAENIRISKVDCSQCGMDTSKTVQPGVSGCVGDCGISDLLLAECARVMATAVVHQGSFEDAFSDEWTEPEPESHTCTAIIDHIIQICDFPTDSVMVKY